MTTPTISIAENPMIAHVARVLAARQMSSNDDGNNPSVRFNVDEGWPEHFDTAVAVSNATCIPVVGIAAIEGQYRIDAPSGVSRSASVDQGIA